MLNGNKLDLSSFEYFYAEYRRSTVEIDRGIHYTTRISDRRTEKQFYLSIIHLSSIVLYPTAWLVESHSRIGLNRLPLNRGPHLLDHRPDTSKTGRLCHVIVNACTLRLGTIMFTREPSHCHYANSPS